jgi:FkbM family methyltransferase
LNLSTTVADILAKAIWLALGRRNLVRVARSLDYRGRLDVPNVMSQNGEMLVQRVALRHAPARAVFVDVGANVGQWTASLLELADEAQVIDLEVHALEPTPGSFEELTIRLEKPLASGLVRARQLGASNREGSGTLYLAGPTAGTNSLLLRDDQHSETTADVSLVTLDSYCRTNRLSHLTMVKIDAEGHDFEILEGASNLLSQSLVEIVQFEYNWLWILSRHYLRDVFDLVGPWGYQIGKVTPTGVEFYLVWDPELETFHEGNYIACKSDWVSLFPRIAWWRG